MNRFHVQPGGDPESGPRVKEMVSECLEDPGRLGVVWSALVNVVAALEIAGARDFAEDFRRDVETAKAVMTTSGRA